MMRADPSESLDDRIVDSPWFNPLADDPAPGPSVDAPTGDGGWRNPPTEVRVVAVAVVWAMAGTLVGLTANLLASVLSHHGVESVTAATAGAVVFAFAGGRMEASG